MTDLTDIYLLSLIIIAMLGFWAVCEKLENILILLRKRP